MVTVNNEDLFSRIVLEGRIDSANAPEIDKQIFDSLDTAAEKIVIDAENLTFISSAGLRVILKLRKNCKDIEITSVSPEVYEVLEMTGFTEMVKVQKAYRKLSVEGCEILGEGSNGVVYRYDPEIVVKVYRNADALAEIHRERQLARRALILGIPTAIPFDVVKVGDSYGSVFELLNAKSFSKLIAAEPENTDKYIEEFVALLKRIHATEVDPNEMSDMKAVALDWARYLEGHLPEEQSKKLISLIESVPERHTMIHGDYHTNNVEMQNGEVLLIDMDTLSFGHPVFEFASMFLGFVGFGELNPANTEKFMKLPYETTKYIWHKALSLYFETEDEARIAEVAEKAMVVGYARLMRRTIKRIGYEDAEGRAIIENCKAHLAELLAKVDTLVF